MVVNDSCETSTEDEDEDEDVVFVADSVEGGFAEVCQILAGTAAIGARRLTAVSDSMATVGLRRDSSTGEWAELRILVLQGGDAAITELLLISTEAGTSASDHRQHVKAARSKLADIVNAVEAGGSAVPSQIGRAHAGISP